MDFLVKQLQSFDFTKVSTGLFIFFIGLILARIISKIAGGIVQKSGMEKHAESIIRKTIFWGLGLIVVLISLEQMGINLTTLIAAAGFLTIAIGFAAQTAFSNIISGIFLLFDRPFVEEEAVQVGDISGVIISIDLLSTKVRTWDNIFVRIPNSALLTETIKNFSRHPIRRLDIPVGIAYKEDIITAQKIILDTARDYHNVLEEPEPTIYVNAMGASGIDLILRAWIPTDVFLQAKSELIETVKRRLDEEGIEIPFPHRTVYLHKVNS